MKTLTKTDQFDLVSLNTPDEYESEFKFENVDYYTPSNNYQLAQLCSLVYQEVEEIHEQISLWNENDHNLNLQVDVVNHDSFRFMVVSNNQFAIVVFRGTVNLDNWQTDFDIIQVPFTKGKGKVHQGFYQSVLKLENEIDEIFSKRHIHKQNVYITGHSLGGAQAAIASLQCDSLREFTSITTFGEPRIGDADFITYFNTFLNSDPPSKSSKIFRQVNRFDPVPHVPVWSYYHESYFYVFSGIIDQTYELIDQDPPSPVFVPDDSIPEETDTSKYSLNNHRMTVYLEKARFNRNNEIFDTN